MKLSMWMIANRLSSFDMDLNIKDDAKACLYSARLAYATNCVYIHEGKKGIICEHNGSYITLFNMNITQAFEIIQSVFDFYEDWLEASALAIQAKDFQRLVDNSHSVLQNPMVLLDGNCRLLGMSSGYSPNDMDNEWKHLTEYGYSSLSAVQSFRVDGSNIDFQHHGEQSFYNNTYTNIGFSGISYCLQYNDISCGRITLLEKDRAVNVGDLQIIQLLAAMLEPVLNNTLTDTSKQNNNIFYNLLFGGFYNDVDLDIQLRYYNWKEDDNYQVTTIELSSDFFIENSIALNIFVHQLQVLLTDCVFIRQKPNLIILSHGQIASDSRFLDIIKSTAASSSLLVGHSLCRHGIKHTDTLLVQSKAAIMYGRLFDANQSVYNFIDYAPYFIINNSSLSECVSSCHPAIVQLHKDKINKNDALFDTLKYYLDYERSISKIAGLLYTHKNTVTYRINKIRDLIPEDMDDPHVRNYLRMSIAVMEMSENINGQKNMIKERL